MDVMQGLELISFEIISQVGAARDKYLEAISQAKKGNFERAEELLREGEKQFVKGHKAHTELILLCRVPPAATKGAFRHPPQSGSEQPG